MDVIVIGAGPAGIMAALRAAELGAKVTLVTREEFGGMAAADGPVPVRTLAHAACLLRRSREFRRYGIMAEPPRLSYPALLKRVGEVVEDVARRSTLRAEADRLGVVIRERAGQVRFLDSHTVESESGGRLTAERIILCTGGVARRFTLPGAEFTATHSDAWGLTEVPPSLIVVGGGMTGLQVASIFHEFGSRVRVFQRGPRILPDDDQEVSAAVAAGLRNQGIEIDEDFGAIDAFEKTPDGIRMRYTKGGRPLSADAALAVMAVGWMADTTGLNLAAAGIDVDSRGFVAVDPYLMTSVPHIYAAGDITGRSVIVPPAVIDAHVAATNAVSGSRLIPGETPVPIGGYTDPEYARVGETEAQAKQKGDVVVGTVRFDETTRMIIDGHTDGFCKLIADRKSGVIVGCHAVGERAADIVQGAAIAMAGGIRVDQLARTPLAFPTHVGILTRTAYRVARQIDPNLETMTHPMTT